MKLPRATAGPWRRLPAEERAAVAWGVIVELEQGLGKPQRQRERRALLQLLLAADPSLARHLTRYERIVRG